MSGENCPRARLTSIDVRIIREAMQHGHRNRDIAKYFKLDKTTVSKIRMNKTWTKK